jgi:hypothetical protein
MSDLQLAVHLIGFHPTLDWNLHFFWFGIAIIWLESSCWLYPLINAVHWIAIKVQQADIEMGNELSWGAIIQIWKIF